MSRALKYEAAAVAGKFWSLTQVLHYPLVHVPLNMHHTNSVLWKQSQCVSDHKNSMTSRQNALDGHSLTIKPATGAAPEQNTCQEFSPSLHFSICLPKNQGLLQINFWYAASWAWTVQCVLDLCVQCKHNKKNVFSISTDQEIATVSWDNLENTYTVCYANWIWGLLVIHIVTGSSSKV